MAWASWYVVRRDSPSGVAFVTDVRSVRAYPLRECPPPSSSSCLGVDRISTLTSRASSSPIRATSSSSIAGGCGDGESSCQRRSIDGSVIGGPGSRSTKRFEFKAGRLCRWSTGRRGTYQTRERFSIWSAAYHPPRVPNSAPAATHVIATASRPTQSIVAAPARSPGAAVGSTSQIGAGPPGSNAPEPRLTSGGPAPPPRDQRTNRRTTIGTHVTIAVTAINGVPKEVASCPGVADPIGPAPIPLDRTQCVDKVDRDVPASGLFHSESRFAMKTITRTVSPLGRSPVAPDRDHRLPPHAPAADGRAAHPDPAALSRKDRPGSDPDARAPRRDPGSLEARGRQALGEPRTELGRWPRRPSASSGGRSTTAVRRPATPCACQRTRAASIGS